MPAGILFLIFVAALALSVPVAIALGISAILPNLVNPSFAASPQLIIRSMIGGVDSFPILAVPMFILSGIIMAKGGVSKKIFNMVSYFIGNKTAGLPCAVVITCLFYGAISGSGPATTAAVGSMTIPILVSLGYDKVFATAIVAVAGGLGVIIPPSIPFILYGMTSGASVGKLFLAGVLPGLLIGGCLMLYAYYYCKTRGEDKEKLNEHYYALKSQGFMTVFKDSFWALFAPVIILGSIYSGIASPTEAATISVFYAIIISLYVYKSLTYRDIPKILREATSTFTPILFILASAVAFARVLTLMQVPQIVAAAITSVFTGKISILIVINILLLFVGMVMDTSPAILILTPILLPIMTSVGVDPIHFGIIMVVNLAIGFVTPPIGINLFVASSLTGIEVVQIARKAAPFIIAFLIALVFITFIPEISLLLTR
ncbi:C4-dicarboxylate transporter, DctM subunit [Geosporobacter subterraneus DSM 17957]|uniref:C4-dicarboxylate transporter, DctM subunit n=1 Tax=Geosporobacter subterraneus DSM 17957 TaxID=1121919 RepID=A0A1M6KBP4_9FIRM|nr:TRAP transporter large permease [Geosporobacter subterraneus]SHJ56302.1 C4-dicarboxylate transporter, DctM subunit [Geosporobacter subterraneus DSM 17957]